MVDQTQLPPGFTLDQPAATPAGGSALPPGYTLDTPGTMEDIAKTAGPALARGATMAVTSPTTLADLAASGLDWLANTKPAKAILPEGSGDTAHNLAEKAHSVLEPTTYGGAIKRLQDNVTGPLYEPQTTGGKYANSALEFLPAAAIGRAGLPALGARAIAALFGGLGSQAGADIATKLGYPEWAGRLVGGGLGGLAGPKLVKAPNVDPAHAAQAQILKDQGMKLTAGQETGNKWMQQREANLMTPKRAENEAQGFNAAVGNQAGMPGAKKFDTPTFQEGQKNVGANQNRVTSGEITPPNFASLQGDLTKMRADAYKQLGAEGIKPIDDFIERVKLGVSGNPNGPTVHSMPGGWYQYNRQLLQNEIDNTQNPTVQHWLGEARKTLDTAMGKEFAPGELKGIHQTTANFNTVRNANVEKGNLSPDALAASIGDRNMKMGTGLAPTAEAGQTVLKRPPASEPGPLARGVGAVVGGLAGKYLGGSGESLVGGILGRDVAGDVARTVARNPITRGAYFNPITQYYLKNGVPGFNLAAGGPLNPALTASLLAGQSSVPRIDIDVSNRTQ